MTPEERFWAKVDTSAGPDGCWEWTAYRNRNGYGRFNVNNVMKTAHRVAWELQNGPITDGLHVLHACDNPPCVNPNHLSLGTHADNMRDMRAKGREWRASATHCLRGHEWTEANSGYHKVRGRRTRYCKECRNAAYRRRWHANK